VNRVHALFGLALALAPAGCSNLDTGGQLVHFDAYAAGQPGAASFDNGRGFHVELTKATMHVGAVYLRLGGINPGSANSSCYGETTYGLEVPGPVDVDTLSPALQEFSVGGEGTTDTDESAEIWLTDGDVNAQDDGTVIVDVAGTATRAGASYPFESTMTISDNRAVPPTDPATPGANPICKQRIIAPIATSLTPEPGGKLALRIDSRAWFQNLDFSTLLPGDLDPSVLVIPDDSKPGAGLAFFDGVTGNSASTYQFSWTMP